MMEPTDKNFEQNVLYKELFDDDDVVVDDGLEDESDEEYDEEAVEEFNDIDDDVEDDEDDDLSLSDIETTSFDDFEDMSFVE